MVRISLAFITLALRSSKSSINTLLCHEPVRRFMTPESYLPGSGKHVYPVLGANRTSEKSHFSY
jgi:hypothetical protein